MRPLVERAAFGALGGLLGAATMTVVRMVAHRVGWLDKTVPQAVEEWADRLTRPGRRRPSHVRKQLQAQLMHLGYGAAWGALAELASRGRAGPGLGAVFGAAQWAVNFLVLMPALGIVRPAWRSHARENLINLGAHLAYGVVTLIASAQLAEQPGSPPTPRHRLSGTVA